MCLSLSRALLAWWAAETASVAMEPLQEWWEKIQKDAAGNGATQPM